MEYTSTVRTGFRLKLFQFDAVVRLTRPRPSEICLAIVQVMGVVIGFLTHFTEVLIAVTFPIEVGFDLLFFARRASDHGWKITSKPQDPNESRP